MIKEDPNEVIIHVGVNNCERDEVDDIITKYKDVGNVIRKSSRVTFSSIISRADKPELNAKIAEINTELRNLCLCNRYDFIDNNNILDILIGPNYISTGTAREDLLLIL